MQDVKAQREGEFCHKGVGGEKPKGSFWFEIS